MSRKESPDRPLFLRMRTQFQTTSAEALLAAGSEDLLTFIRKAPLHYGFWGDFKRLVKASEKATYVELTAALLARIDTADLARHSPYPTGESAADRFNGMGRMYLYGDFAYVLGNWSAQGLHVIDLTHPALPTLAAHIKEDSLIDVAVDGTSLYLLQGTSGGTPGRISRYDISDPRHPKPMSGIEMANGSRIAVAGSLIAALTSPPHRPGLHLIDASHPAQLRLLGRLDLSFPTAIQIVGRTAYIVNSGPRGRGQASLVIVDLSDPLQPRKVQEIVIPPTTDLAVQGRYAYLACSPGRNTSPDNQTGLVVIDLVPPTFIGAHQISLLPVGNVQNIAVNARYAYVTVGRSHYGEKNTGGLRIVDIQDPSNPILAGILLADEAADINVQGDIACLLVSDQWHNRFRTFDVSEPTRPVLYGASPGRETLGYMKRRGRRQMRILALRDPDAYVRTAVQILLEAGTAQPELDMRMQWITMDLLYGGGTRFEQHAHGRGSYGAPHPGLSLRTREERFPELWDRYPDLAQHLYTMPGLPWQTREAACKMLRNAKTPLPALSDRMLAHFLASGSPLLRSVAARQVAEMLETGRNVAPDVVADTYFAGTRRQRATLERFMARQESGGRWSVAFATCLSQIAGNTVSGTDLPRKAILAFALLIARFPTLVSRDILPQTAIALYGAGRPDFESWALEVFRNLLPAQLPGWLFALASLPDAARETAAQAVITGFASKAIPVRTLADLVRHPDGWVRHISWRIVAHSQTPPEDITALWGGLLSESEPTPALLTAFASSDALILFARCDFDSRAMALRLERSPFLLPLLPLAALEKVVAVLPPPAVVRLAAEATDEQWPGLRLAILLGPLLPDRRAAFWREAFAAIGATGNANLIARLLDDSPMQNAFLQLADISAYLPSANPVFGGLLGRWIAAHYDLLRSDSAELLQIATHPLPEIRTVGLRRVQQVRMSLPFALRLLESELPPSVAVGKTFFEQIETGDSRRIEAITALCDSPKPSVRAYGRETLTARPDMLDNTDMLERLSENPDPETQAFVAGELLGQSTPPDQTFAFDRAVLRARDRGRRAKELVKARLDAQPTPDIALLLEMARSRTPRDADWALGQLAKLALDGVEIPGFTLDGVAGG